MKKVPSKAGRKPTYPAGSNIRTTRVPPLLDAALQAYCKRQDVPPAPSSVLLAALEKFLRESGDYKI